MFFIPGWLIAAVTFPGVMLHEWAHKFFCDRFQVRVLAVRYFQFGQDVAGFVQHDPPSTFRQHLFIGIAPLIVNSLAAIIVAAMAAQAKTDSALMYFFWWLSMSFGAHALPSRRDADSIGDSIGRARASGASAWILAAWPLVQVLRVASALKLFWIDIIFAAALVVVGAALGTHLP